MLRQPGEHASVTVERRSARIERSAIDEVQSIRTLLADVYKDAADGRTLLRELVQNADDASARRLIFCLFDSGWSHATNSLLRGPALLVANDGPFLASDRDALHRAVGGSKADDAAKVGRFGLGFKSVFHVCEAVVYLGAAGGTLRPGALNPWAGTGERGDADPLHPDWDSVTDDDLERLSQLASNLLGDFDDGLIQWIPLRLVAHLDRAENCAYGIGRACPSADEVAGWFGQTTSLALLLAQCGHLDTIDAQRASEPTSIAASQTLGRVVRPGFERGAWVGRPDRDNPGHIRSFAGQIQDGQVAWSVSGVDAVGHDALTRLKGEDGWPQDSVWRDGRSVSFPRKALAHAAVTVLRPEGPPAPTRGARLRWSVFLPLDNDPHPQSTATVDCVGGEDDAGVWEVMLHGYFWPSQDRRSIPGVTDDDADSGESVRKRWNRALRDDLLLPLLPRALADVAQGVSETVARGVLGAIVESRTVRANLPAVLRRDLLLPVITAVGVQWEARSQEANRVLSIPKWMDAPDVVRRDFVARSRHSGDDIVFTDEDAPKLARMSATWSVDCFERLLDCVSLEVLRSTEGLTWVGTLLKHVLGTPANEDSECSASAADWLAHRIADGALSLDRRPRDAQSRLKDAWQHVFTRLPSAWLINAPVASRGAVVELAKVGGVGVGLLPLPFGRTESTNQGRPDVRRIDAALRMLGKRQLMDPRGSQHTRARLSLADTLLAARGDAPLDQDLRRVPIVAALRLPDGRDEAWSLSDLDSHAKALRVFVRAGDKAGPGDSGTVADPKQAVSELAMALGEPAWLVGRSAGSLAGAPNPTTNNLARAVLERGEIGSATGERTRLLGRFAKGDVDPLSLQAMRALLAGRQVTNSDAPDLFYVRNQDSEGELNGRTLTILLRLARRPWCALNTELVESLPLKLLESLGVVAVDTGVLRRLLDNCLTEEVDWVSLGRIDILHLLRRLHGRADEDRRRWCTMPLHRGPDGRRTSFDERALRAEGGQILPAELKSETRLLNPDPEVADLYAEVPVLNREGILKMMLLSSRPQQFADQIVRALLPNGRVNLPEGKRLLERVREVKWLPLRGDEAATSPAQMLLLSENVCSALGQLGKAGALGEHHLGDELQPAFWRAAQPVVHETLGRPTAAKCIEALAQALAPRGVATPARDAHALLPRPEDIDVPLIDDAIRSPLRGTHPGWALMSAAASATCRGDTRLEDSSENARNAVLALGESLCGPVTAASQVTTLSELAAARPTKDSAAGRSYQRLLRIFARTACFSEQVMPQVDLPTQDGRWHAASEVARSASGVAKRHRVLVELRTCLGLDDGPPVNAQAGVGTSIGRGTAPVLSNYFKEWEGRLPSGAVGAFLALLGPGKDDAVEDLAQRWLGRDVHIESVRHDLLSADRAEDIRVFVNGQIARGEHVEAMNLLGQQIEMLAGADDDSIFATDPVRKHGAVTFWQIALRDVQPQERSAPDLVELLGGAVEWWAVRVLGVGRERVRSWWSTWGTGSQTQVAPVHAAVLADLPLMLSQIDVHDDLALGPAVRAARSARIRRRQAPPMGGREALELERAAFHKLESLVTDDTSRQHFLWTRVQAMMRRYGYREDSVLLELAQNADDALAQAAEICGGELPAEAKRLIVRVHERHDGLTLDLIHYGRAINDTGGPAFPAGSDRQWDLDLYFMMLLNLSAKPGETPGQGTSAATTGRFGLGFKSVHLLSDRPSVVSGFLAFSIAGGLLPVEEPVPDDPDLAPVHDRRPTRIRLPIRTDVESDDLLGRVFERFSYAQCVIPVFARQIREIIVDGGPSAGSNAYHPEPIEGAPGWSTAHATTVLPGHGQWRMLRFRPADADAHTGTAAVLIGLRDGVPASFPADLPFLWNVTPTSEGWCSGYAVNGPFKLDPGRTHVSLDDVATCRVADALGEALGTALVELQDALDDAGEASAPGLPRGEQAEAFVGGLWRVLATGFGEQDLLRRAFLKSLHGPGRGLSRWMMERSVVPSRLPPPFAPRLPALPPGIRVEVAADFSPGLCRALNEVADLAGVLQQRRAVSTEVATLLKPFLGDLRPFRPADVMGELISRWAGRLTRDRLHALRPLARDEIWKSICGDADSSSDWRDPLRASAATGELTPLRKLLLPRTLPPGILDPRKDESLRSAFAPDGSVLDSGYVEGADDLQMFLRLRERHRVDADTMAGWYQNMPHERRRAALMYLVVGELGDELVTRLASQEDRPDWLRDPDEVRAMLKDLDEDPGRSLALLARLFVDQAENPESSTMKTLEALLSGDDQEDESEPERVASEEEQRIFFERFREWWDDPSTRRRILAKYEDGVWPAWLRSGGIAKGLEADSRDHWTALLVLGACRSLGRSKPVQHRTFLELAQREGWWDVFKSPQDPQSWMQALRTWQDDATASLKYWTWMSLFPTIYQLSRYMETYRRLLTSAGRRPANIYEITRLLTPRVDEALTGAGQHFDAPPVPLNMGLHWILRELVRLGVVDGEHLFPDCWVPAAQVIRFLGKLGLDDLDDKASNSEKAQAIFLFMNEKLGTEAAHLHRAFDIPLRHVARDRHLQRELGLKT